MFEVGKEYRVTDSGTEVLCLYTDDHHALHLVTNQSGYWSNLKLGDKYVISQTKFKNFTEVKPPVTHTRYVHFYRSKYDDDEVITVTTEDSAPDDLSGFRHMGTVMAAFEEKSNV